MTVTQLFDDESSTCTYLLADEGSRSAILIDPVLEQIDRDMATIASLQLDLQWVLETHVHADHVTSAAELAQRTGARISVPAACGVVGASRQVVHGDRVAFGSTAVTALHTPGHTAGSTCYLWNAGTEAHVFTGDTLLIGGCGRTDFQSGSASALYRSITGILFALPAATIVWPGHAYASGRRSTIGEERASNPRLFGKSEEEFVELMAKLDLPAPRKLATAVPANLHLKRL